MSETITCSRCIITNRFPGVTFSPEGLCNECRSEASGQKQTDWAARRVELEARIAAIRKEATSYHAVVPWSGGKDSSYVLYVLRQVYGLKVLAVNFDNGMKSAVAYENIDNLSRRMGIDVVVLKPDPELLGDMYAHYLKEKGELCSVCNVAGYVVFNSWMAAYAKTLGYVPLIVGGWSGTHENIRAIFTFDYGELRRVLERDPRLVQRFESNGLVDARICAAMRKAGDPRVAGLEGLGEKFFHLPDYMDWDVVKIKETLESELGWKAVTPIGAHEDCRWHNCMKHLMKTKFGIDNDVIAVAAMVRSGSLDRAEGLRMVEQCHSEVEPPEMSELLSTFGCAKQQVNTQANWYSGQNVGRSVPDAAAGGGVSP